MILKFKKKKLIFFIHNIPKIEINTNTRRKLILVAKVVQGIANENAEFNEAYMNQIRDLLVEYIGKTSLFL